MRLLSELFGSILKFIYDYVGNYGWAIVLFALFSRIIQIPITYMQQKSAIIMKAMGPDQKKIQEWYKNDQAKQQAELSALYKRYNYKMFSGTCLPLLIMLALIPSLFNALRMPETYVFGTQEAWGAVNKEFLWIADIKLSPSNLWASGGFSVEFLLSLVFPILSIGTSFIQQKFAATGADNQQARMMTLFGTGAIILASFFYTQGLCIYWTIQSFLTIGQNMFTKKFIKIELPEPLPDHPVRKRKKKKAPPTLATGASQSKSGGA